MGDEYLALQGMVTDRRNDNDFPEDLKMRLAGDAYNMANVAQVTIGLFCGTPWHLVSDFFGAQAQEPSGNGSADDSDTPSSPRTPQQDPRTPQQDPRTSQQELDTTQLDPLSATQLDPASAQKHAASSDIESSQE